jgi:sugar phosphate isomerase/epimerase
MNKIGLSTSSVFPYKIEDTFSIAKSAGYDGIELMITSDKLSREVNHLKRLEDKYSLPILSIHAPVLLLTHFVWGTDPEIKLRKTAEHAAEIGAKTVVVHPPFAWQGKYAENFISIVNEIAEETSVEIGVENMFPWKYKGREMNAYKPSWDTIANSANSITVDFSHAALSGVNSLELVKSLGDRLHHIHLCDGSINTGSSTDKIFDEHLMPGEGNQPIVETLQHLARNNWDGQIVAEVNTRKQRSKAAKIDVLAQTAEYARKALREA